MEQNRFHLQRGTSVNKISCPACHGKRCFRKYIDEEGKIIFPDTVGRCDHENHCAYHYTPKQFFADNPDMKPKDNSLTYSTSHKVYMPRPEQEVSYIDASVMQKSLTCYDANPLFNFLRSKFGEVKTRELFLRYNVGTARVWGGATVFWQVDANRLIRTGKVIKYDDNGHRVKAPYSRINWAHSLLKIENFHLKQCLFGEHLLAASPDKLVAMVESEKTALIASFYLPQYVWLATGGKGICWHEEVLHVLRGRKVVLFPDLKATEEWRGHLPLLTSVGAMPSIFEELEHNVTDEEREAGLDIADFLLRIDSAEGVWESMKRLHPALADLEQRLDLVVEGFAPL